MKIVTLAALAAAFSMPIAVSAQVAQPPAQTVQGQGQTNQAAHEYHRWTKRLANVNLSQQQQQQVQHLLDQFNSTHPAGSPRDRQGAYSLEQQIFGVLTPQQQTQVRQQMQAQKMQEQQRRQQQQQQPPVQAAPPAR